MFCTGGFTGPKNGYNGYFQRCVCDKAAAQMAQFWAVGIVSGTSRHPKDVPLVSESWWGMYSLGDISPWKQQISAIFARPYFMVQRHLPGGSTRHSLLEPMLQWVHRHTATRQIVLVSVMQFIHHCGMLVGWQSFSSWCVNNYDDDDNS